MTKRTRPYGSWQSPISASMVAGGLVLPHQLAVSEGIVYWSESRPQEQGRKAIMRVETGSAPVEVTPPDFDCRTRVHEYGGGAFLADGHTVFSSNGADQRLYRLEYLHDPVALTPEPEVPAGRRYADGRLTPNKLQIVAVEERHSPSGVVTNALVSIDPMGTGEPRVLISGRDFYATPCPSPDGSQLAWLEWDHPNMPWNGTELWVAEIDQDGTPKERRMIAGGLEESIFQPAWDRAGTLHFISDRTGWWNLYRWTGQDQLPLAPMEAEFGLPAWIFGLSRYAFLDDGRIACMYSQDGIDNLGLIDDGLTTIETGLTSFYPAGLQFDNVAGRLVFVGANFETPTLVFAFDVKTHQLETLNELPSGLPDPGYISQAETITFPTEDGQQAHALYYAPRNRDYQAPAGSLPPMVVVIHGGPTSYAKPEFTLARQYFTSRGFALVDVNYRGSIGYGREYRELLKGKWGVVDVEDCVNAAKYLVAEGKVDRERIVIRGRSAGGFTTLLALIFHDFFRAGASYFGVADAEAFASQTHKYEAHYDEWLIGAYPEEIEKYRARSPINFVDKISSPVVLFQGLEDEIVVPEQARMLVAALEGGGLPYAYIEFEGEGHGFRKSETVRRALEAELYFYAQIMGIELEGALEPVQIHNLDPT